MLKEKVSKIISILINHTSGFIQWEQNKMM